MSKLLVYPVILHPADTGYTVEVPDITGGFTQGEDLTNALEMASDMIGLMLEDTTNYPKPSKLESIHVADNDIKTIVAIDMDNYRRNNSKTIRKTVTVPEYLVKMGKEKNLNFSAVLTKALKTELNL
ncbi:type II toxin-antitoxin system HicB family antitoxin [Lactobacillus laiwuensis]|uniref:type II toxin-antitoxin system HicB family antitoxin n=1 Tax=Lactobacillus laiwuensis TaxID=2841034 RepID=UPI001CC62D7C|nr:type II toxin-antitoxin system HicB family antitoxin [Lactobacillus laiwuensis]